LLGFCKVEDYTVPPWYAGFVGVPGRLLRLPVSDLGPRQRAQALIARISFLSDFLYAGSAHFDRKVLRILSGEGSFESPVRRSSDQHVSPVETRPPVGPSRFVGYLQLLGWSDSSHHYFVNCGKSESLLRRRLGAALEKFVHLPLSELRSGLSLKGPGCVSCVHETCSQVYWVQGRPPRKSRRPRLDNSKRGERKRSRVRNKARDD
jgi:hypothetical protein